MAKINYLSVIALLACFVAASSADLYPLKDELGNLCLSPCVVTREYFPVCGSNGETYPNPSSLACHNKCLRYGVTQIHFGECVPALAPLSPAPTCPCAATYEYYPVCGTNGETYPNHSTLKCAAKCQKKNIQMKHMGECAPLFPAPACPCAVTYEYLPLCGTDGETYPNPSYMKCAAKCQKKNIQMKHVGNCA